MCNDSVIILCMHTMVAILHSYLATQLLVMCKIMLLCTYFLNLQLSCDDTFVKSKLVSFIFVRSDAKTLGRVPI